MYRTRRKGLSVVIALCLAISILLPVDVLAADTSVLIIDMANREVLLNEPVERVFVDWASGITLVMTLEATDRLVTVPSAFHSDTFAWCQLICPKLNSIPDDDPAYENIEGVIKYNPQLVITSTKDMIEKYELLGLNVIYVKFTDDKSFQESIRVVGQALGETTYQRALQYCEYMDNNIEMVCSRTSILAENDKPSVYYMDSRFTDPYHTVGRGEIQEGWITYAGGKLATAELFEGRNIEITAEELLKIDPEIILIGAQNQAVVKEMLISDPVLAELSAVKEERITRIPQGMFPWCRTGPEAAMQALWAGKLLHPELFEDISIIDIARDFYKQFYGAVLSNEQLQGILAGKLTPDAD